MTIGIFIFQGSQPIGAMFHRGGANIAPKRCGIEACQCDNAANWFEIVAIQYGNRSVAVRDRSNSVRQSQRGSTRSQRGSAIMQQISAASQQNGAIFTGDHLS